jgi:alpha-amylase/alpha-mannosidase (GH57 family)
MDRYICIHGHFYQPPRENPWLEEIEFQDSAYPYHDWNEKITAECYAPNAASRILDTEGKIIDIVNIYSKISFDFGPTLLSWLERHKLDVYEEILEADRLSMEKFDGCGSAMAQAYNHIILPLANRQDKYTQITWGIKDFEKRFKRLPEGMWLPETAVDKETLEVLVSLGIEYTVLSPRQAKRTRKLKESKKWIDVSGENIDPARAYLCLLPSGRSINIFFYDGPASQEVSFGGLLNNGEAFAKKLLSLFNDERDWDQLVHLASDGETYGHHHRFGDMALSYALHYIESNNLAKITNYSNYLKNHPPTHVVDIHENSSWSCVHGVERWRNDCGCNSGMHRDWHQVWRKHLRHSLDWLRDKLIPIYRNEAAKYLKNPWDARDDYIKIVLDRTRENVESFINAHSIKKLAKDEKVTALKLLEMQRNAMLMYTSCGWFFDEISGIETVQIMQYASKAIQYAEEYKNSIEPDFIKHLEKAPSNIFGNAAEAYNKYVKSAKTDLLRVGAHYSLSSIFEEYSEDTAIYCYSAKSEVHEKIEGGRQSLSLGKTIISSEITWEEREMSFAVLHLGDHNINAGVKDFNGNDEFHSVQEVMRKAFEKGDIPEVVRLMDKHFEGNIYTLWHLFRDEQRKVLNQILQLTYEGVETSYRHIYEDNYAIISFYHSLQHRIPRPLSIATEYILNTDLKKIFKESDIDIEKLNKIIDETDKWNINIDKTTVGFIAGTWINSAMEKLSGQPENLDMLKQIHDTLEVLAPLSLSPDLWKAQNIYFSISKNLYISMKDKASKNNKPADTWVNGFIKLGHYLQIKI